MSDYYEILGELTFPSAKDANEAVAALRAVHDGETTFFWSPKNDPAATDLVVEGSTVHFAWKGFAGGAESYYTTRRVLEELVTKAVSGRVGLREGEGGPIEYFGYKPRKPAAAAKKPVAKKPTAKKPAGSASPPSNTSAKRSRCRSPRD